MMGNAQQNSSAAHTWKLVREGSHLVPSGSQASSGTASKLSSSGRKVACVFVVDAEVPCDIRVSEQSKSGKADSNNQRQ